MDELTKETCLENLRQLVDEVSRLEALELSCEGAIQQDKHITFFAGPMEKNLRALRRDMIQLIDRIGETLAPE